MKLRKVIDIIKNNEKVRKVINIIKNNEKVRKVINIITIIILISILANSFGEVSTYSKYFYESAESVVAKYDEYHHLLYNIGEYSNDYITMRFGILGGNKHLGTLSAIEDTTINIQTKRRCGNLKILFVDESEDIYHQLILENSNDMELETGVYEIYLIGDWFSGKCTINYTDAVFENI